MNEDLYNLCRDYIQTEHGHQSTAYRIEDDGSRTQIILGHHELVIIQDQVRLGYFTHGGMVSYSFISYSDNFNLEYMLEKTSPRELNSPVSHMLRNPVIEYQRVLRENTINELIM